MKASHLREEKVQGWGSLTSYLMTTLIFCDAQKRALRSKDVFKVITAYGWDTQKEHLGVRLGIRNPFALNKALLGK